MRFPVALQTLADSRSEPGSRSQEKWHGHKTTGEVSFVDWPVRLATASPERIGESSRNSGSDCAAPGWDGKADGQMCVTVPWRWGARSVAP